MLRILLFLSFFCLFSTERRLFGQNEPLERERPLQNENIAIDYVPPNPDIETTTSEALLKNQIHEKQLYKILPKFKQSNQSTSMPELFKQWHQFKKEHGKMYDTFREEKRRFGIFLSNIEHVRLHNLAFDMGLKTYTTKVNKYADMTTEEFVKTMNGFKRELGDPQNQENRIRFRIPLNFEAPQEMDWRQKGFVTPVKDQGHCGSCWAFSSTGSLEGQHKRKTGTLISLSEQNLVDCSYKFGNEGCNGGLMDNAFQYIKQNKGVDTETAYPYEAKEGKCRFKKAAIGADDVGFIDIESGNETALRDALASQGPVSVAIDAGHKSFQLYEKGVYFEPKCSADQLDHGVLAIGYGTSEDGKDFWLIKNSWGIGWGEQGYIRISRNKENHCGVATQASYPSV